MAIGLECHGEAEPEGEALDVLVDLPSPHLRPRALGSDQQNEVTDASDRI